MNEADFDNIHLRRRPGTPAAAWEDGVSKRKNAAQPDLLKSGRARRRHQLPAGRHCAGLGRRSQSTQCRALVGPLAGNKIVILIRVPDSTRHVGARTYHPRSTANPLRRGPVVQRSAIRSLPMLPRWPMAVRYSALRRACNLYSQRPGDRLCPRHASQKALCARRLHRAA